MAHEVYASGRVVVARLRHGGDLLQEITRVAKERNITVGVVTALGALKRGRLAFYDQVARTYGSFQIDESLEIASLTGNVSLKDGDVFVHAHATLSDEQGRCFAGHLVEGCEVFAGETTITELQGSALNRTFDEQTGLGLWEELREP